MKTANDYNKLNKRLIAILIVVVTAACFAFVSVSFAAYTHSTRAQRTIAAYESSGVMFSSNLLKMVKNVEENDNKFAYATIAGGKAYASVTVCNHEQGKAKYYPTAIAYTITATLVKFNDSTNKYVAASAGDVGAYSLTLTHEGVTKTLSSATLSTSFTDTLNNDTAHTDTYDVTFSDGWANDKRDLFLQLVVTTTAEFTDGLKGIIKPNVRMAEARTNWQGAFNDSDSHAPSDYDGYNYVVWGTGTGTFTLKWNNTKVTLSDVSLDNVNYYDARNIARREASESTASLVTVTTDGNISKIEFNVDATEYSRYEFVFFKKNITTETWATHMNENLASASATPTTVVGYYFESA